MKNDIITAVGRRKTAVASVRLMPAKEATLKVNGKTPRDYFKTEERTTIALEAFSTAETAQVYAATAHVSGGGIAAQADAVRHALSRAITKAEAMTRTKLKKAGFLRRDQRAKERKKPGLKKARKAPQWSKR